MSKEQDVIEKQRILDQMSLGAVQRLRDNTAFQSMCSALQEQLNSHTERYRVIAADDALSIARMQAADKLIDYVLGFCDTYESGLLYDIAANKEIEATYQVA
jgi:hypothetical protein